MNSYLQKIQSLNLVLPPPPKPVGSYRPVILAGKLAFLSGQVSRMPDGSMLTGKVGKDLTLEQGKEAARIAVLNAISLIQEFIKFEQFDQMVRLVGYVQTAPDFYEIPAVMNGASDLLLEIFGEKGVHARSAVGMASLPMNAAVEIEITLQVK
jgi:enamine deaminase RidA (YjgF/YER057c/UK114 family)